MVTSLFSSAWYRVADLKPRLRTHTAIHRQVFRGQIWYVLQDHQTGRFHRLSPIANLMLCLMDGQRTMRDIWEIAGRKSKDDPPTQDETIHLLAQLHNADLLQGEIPPDFDEMAERSEKAGRRRLMQRLRSPLAVRVPLFDPDRILNLTLPLVRPIFSVFGFVAWLALVLTGVVLAILHWPELTSDVTDRVLATQNVALLMAVYPVVKSLHELGHAYATKVWGGEVHELGVMLLVFIPVLYVDASASAAFRQKHRRIVVGAAGIMVEMALAAVSLIVWLHATPGLGRTVAFNVILIGGVSTLLFNGNPLLRFDGYYIFSDLVEIPNLATRGNAYLFYLVQKYLLKIDSLDKPVAGPGEPQWLIAYAMFSFIYRLAVSTGIALFLAAKMFLLGVMMAIWAMSAIAVIPIFKGLRFLATSPKLRGRRRHAFAVVGGIVAAALIVMFTIPLPYSTVAEGVVIAPDQAEVRTRTEGFIEQVLTKPGAVVAPDQPLVTLTDPTLDARVAVIEAQLDEARQRLEGVRQVDRVQAEMLEDQAAHLADKLKDYRGRQKDLTVRAQQSGRFIMADAQDRLGHYVKRGELLGYVVSNRDQVVRSVVSQADVDLIRRRTTGMEAHAVEELDRPIPARVLREVPAAQQDVPSLALTTRGGGTIALDPSKTQRPQALFSLFQLDVELRDPGQTVALGSRVYVRFFHGDEPVGWRIMRTMRQFFLGQFRV
ncbi:MAG TPA: peptidase M50 [Xanthobacteraceae bacterium]|nr:peptidase M50 [Xanthobacteraceae bacterium]